MVCTGEDEPDEVELDVAVDADEERRSDVRMLLGEKRERIIWKREDCMFLVLVLVFVMFGLRVGLLF